jgi:hypothetical protein
MGDLVRLRAAWPTGSDSVRASPKSPRRKTLSNFRDHEIECLWRELARLITFSDEPSPQDFSSARIREFFGKWRARQGSNLRPPA